MKTVYRILSYYLADSNNRIKRYDERDNERVSIRVPKSEQIFHQRDDSTLPDPPKENNLTISK